MTDLDVYQPAQLGQYQAGIIMDEKAARALDDQVRRCTEAVLREGTDYGVIPGTNGEKSLWRPGAQKLLQWFGLGFTCERVEIERADDGRKHGITYRAIVARRLPDGTLDVKATCEGTADYDESKFYQPAEEVQRKAEYNERKWAKQYGRVADPTKWKNRGEYRADWNALMKRAQKRAIVGAVVDATAAGGIFSDREEDDHAPPPDDTPPAEQRHNPAARQQDGDTLFQQLLTEAANLKTDAAAARITSQAKTAAKKNELTLEQEGRIQDRIQRTLARLHENAEPVDVADLARASSEGAKEEAPPGGEADRLLRLLSEADPWRDKIEGLTDTEEARAALQELGHLVTDGKVDMTRANRISRAIAARFPAVAEDPEAA